MNAVTLIGTDLLGGTSERYGTRYHHTLAGEVMTGGVPRPDADIASIAWATVE